MFRLSVTMILVCQDKGEFIHMSTVWVWIHPVLLVLAVMAIIYAVVNFSSVKRVLIGRPIRSRELNDNHNRLLWFVALPILAADLYSSVAYGDENKKRNASCRCCCQNPQLCVPGSSR